MGGLVLALIAAMEIQIPGTCPGLADVQRHLAPLLPPGFDARTQDRALVAEGPDGAVTVLLARADGGATATRQLPRAGSCEDQAETIAVLLASWEGQIHPELALRAADARPAEPRAADLATTAVAPAPPRGLALDSVGAGVGVGGRTLDSAAPGARMDLFVGAAQSRWRGRLSLEAAGEQTLGLAMGQGKWWRAALGLGADYTARLSERWVAGVGAGAALGLVSISGSNYLRDASSTSLDVAAEALARIEWRRGRVAPWLGVALLTRLRRQDIQVQGAAASAALPILEPSVALGADFRWGR